jgi:glucokinase
MPDPQSFISLAAAELPLFVGIDLGGTNTKLGLVDNQGRTLAYHSVPTRVEQGPDHAIAQMAAGVEHLLRSAGVEKSAVGHLGLATPGPMDLERGLLLTPGNLPGWWDYPIRYRVAEACGLPVRFANDANAAAFGEYWQGAGANTHTMVLLTLGTGLGGGIVIQDMLVEGAHSNGAECGFLLIDPHPDARRDSLGLSGTLEAYCGSYGVVGRAVDALEAGRDSTLQKQRQAGEPITPLAIAEAAEAGDSLALETVMDTARYLARGIVTLIHTLDPDSVVLGGAMNFGGTGHPLGERFIDQVRQEVRPRLLPALRGVLRIEFAQLGGDAGYMGAAGLARSAFHANNKPLLTTDY